MLDHVELRPDEPVVIAGGGLLGIEAACALAKRDARVTLLHRGQHLMNRQLDFEAGRLLAKELTNRGIELRFGSEIEALQGEVQVSGVQLRDGKDTLPAGLMIWATGIVPETALARVGGLRCRTGVQVNAQLRSSDTDIFAIGECAEFAGETVGLVAPAYAQSEACAAVLAGDEQAEYAPAALATRLKVSGVEVFSMGRFEAESGDEILHYRDRALGVYRKLLLRDDQLVGALCYGDSRDAGWYEQLILSGEPVGALRAGLAFGEAVCEQLNPIASAA
jgi:nitrite reductase (NADH) large subunit